MRPLLKPSIAPLSHRASTMLAVARPALTTLTMFTASMTRERMFRDSSVTLRGGFREGFVKGFTEDSRIRCRRAHAPSGLARGLRRHRAKRFIVTWAWHTVSRYFNSLWSPYR